MQRSIKKVAVLGSGVMGSRIACHFAGVGVEVLLLDMLNPGTEESKNIKERNKLVDVSSRIFWQRLVKRRCRSHYRWLEAGK